ncbi:ParB/RepB/Spo0J family partition protein [Pseudomaricurvus alkylphenolicus]|uniref:ParB/RepB/Spo0J family partition protein n=1 Tax=Pseudomaricurvus alkylphenolicus TaxID=1306991 RepID=UPI001421E482|nr:ParB/RepB/Spo0J family partition protein [Pseudomaricurvus alkylphenolicus]NIB44327.1 ParB/RepB/Spo0J family partition protein [Pseudomaricurvus alkylphenolicus]
MAKVDMSKFRAKRSEGQKSNGEGNATANTKTPRTEKSTASPTLSRAPKSGAFGGKKTERKSIRLPVTGADIDLVASSVDPDSCLIHKNNRRIQALLTEDNPKVVKLKNAIEKEGQRDPVLARMIEVDGEKRVEIIDGSRRRFVSQLLKQSHPDTKLRVWIGHGISDADADYLTRSENENRDDISAWETAQHLKKQLDENPTWTHDVLAANEGMARQTVSDYLALAEVPLALVQLLSSPDLLKVSTGLQIVRSIKSLSVKELKQLSKALEKEAPFGKANELVKAIKSLHKPATATEKPTANKKIEIKSGDTLRAEIGRNRRVQGQYKIDLYDLTESEYEAIYNALEKLLK